MLARLLLCQILFLGSLNGQAQELYHMGLLEDDGQYDQLPCKADLQKKDYSQLPSSHSLKIYCPKAMSQGSYGTCVGWSTAYAARTIAEAIKWGWTDQAKISKEAFSPLFVYAQIKKGGDNNCSVGANIHEALKLMKDVGSVKYTAFNTLCADYVSQQLKHEASKYKINDFFTLFNKNSSPFISKVAKVKKAISENNPVIIGMKVPKSFHRAGSVWTEGGEGTGRHALCVVGYDDYKNGGAFQVMNSWGTSWGDNGFTWIRYSDFEKYVNHAYEIYVKRINLLENYPDSHQQSRQEISFRERNPIHPRNNSPIGNISGSITDQQSLKLNNLSGSISLQLSDGERIGSAFNRQQGTYNLTRRLVQGNRFQLFVTNYEPAYVYVIGFDASNHTTKLFPNKDNVSAAMTYKSSHLIIPGEDDYFKVDNMDEIKNICILYSKEPLNFNQIIDRINSAHGSYTQKVRSVISDSIIPTSQVNFLSNSISYQVQAEKSIVPVFIGL